MKFLQRPVETRWDVAVGVAWGVAMAPLAIALLYGAIVAAIILLF